MENNAGFSIVELMVSLAIVTLIGTTVVINQHQFNQSVKLNNFVHDIAMEVRSLQSRALNVESQNLSTQQGWGIAIENFNIMNNGTVNVPERLVVFNDRNQANGSLGPDGIYTPLAGDIQEGVYNIYSTPFDIVQMCAQFTDGTAEFCYPPIAYDTRYAGDNHIMNFSYVRPFADPYMFFAFKDGVNKYKRNLRGDNPIDEIHRFIITIADLATQNRRYILIDSGGRITTTGTYPNLEILTD